MLTEKSTIHTNLLHKNESSFLTYDKNKSEKKYLKQTNKKKLSIFKDPCR